MGSFSLSAWTISVELSPAADTAPTAKNNRIDKINKNFKFFIIIRLNLILYKIMAISKLNINL